MITLGVKDIDRSIHFYENGLCLPSMSFEGNVAFFKLSGSWLSLYPWSALAEDADVSTKGEGFRGVILAHNVASNRRLMKLWRKLRKPDL